MANFKFKLKLSHIKTQIIVRTSLTSVLSSGLTIVLLSGRAREGKFWEYLERTDRLSVGPAFTTVCEAW